MRFLRIFWHAFYDEWRLYPLRRRLGYRLGGFGEAYCLDHGATVRWRTGPRSF